MGKALAVRRIRLTNYRNYVSAGVSTGARPVLLTGVNGAGKTNLLEAVSLLAPGRGLRRARTAEIDRSGAGPWTVAATVDTVYGEIDVGTGRDPSGERRLVRLNGAPAKSQAALGDYINVVWLTPQMDRLFIDGAGARRRFLDRLIFGFDPAHAGRCVAYEKALRERGRLLKDGRGDDAWLSALEAQVAERGIAIAAARREMAARLHLACATADGPFPGAGIAVEGKVEEWLAQLPALEVEERIRSTLSGDRQRDAESGGATVGPHRSDLAVRHLEKDMAAAQCSTGEQKALLIAIVLAHAQLQAAQHGAAPILLLDEVAAHLDSVKRQALFDTILGLGAQAWLTGTDAEVFEDLRGKADAFRVEAAEITPLWPD